MKTALSDVLFAVGCIYTSILVPLIAFNFITWSTLFGWIFAILFGLAIVQAIKEETQK